MRSGILRKIPLFAMLPLSEIKYLASMLVPHTYPESYVLFREGSLEEEFYILLEGKVENSQICRHF